MFIFINKFRRFFKVFGDIVKFLKFVIDLSIPNGKYLNEKCSYQKCASTDAK